MVFSLSLRGVHVAIFLGIRTIFSGSQCPPGVYPCSNDLSSRNQQWSQSSTTGEGPFSCAEFSAEGLSCESFGWPKARRQRLIIDGIAYNGEADILEARLRELAPVINYTAILTTERNFHGVGHEVPHLAHHHNVKSLKLPSSAFDVCLDSSSRFDNLCAMAVTKNSIALVIEELDVGDDDWVIFSDPDEIPNREVVRLLRECEIPISSSEHRPHHIRFWSRAHYMYSTRCQVQQSLWTGPLDGELPQGPVAMKVKTMRSIGLMGVRKDHAAWCRANGPYASCGQAPAGSQLDLPCSAWHLSSFGGLEMLVRKMKDNADMWVQLPPQEVMRMMRSCKERDTNRTILNAKLHRHPLMSYPGVPHSVADDHNRFAAFFDLGMSQSIQAVQQVRRRTSGSSRANRRRRRRTSRSIDSEST